MVEGPGRPSKVEESCHTDTHACVSILWLFKCATRKAPGNWSLTALQPKRYHSRLLYVDKNGQALFRPFSNPSEKGGDGYNTEGVL